MNAEEGYTLEDYIKHLHGVISKELIKLYEPYRLDVEWWLSNFADSGKIWYNHAKSCPIEVNSNSLKIILDEINCS